MRGHFGRLALVTGGGSGIGKAVCQALTREGAKVIVADKNYEAAKLTASELGPESLALEVDVSSDQSVYKCLNDAIKNYKRSPQIVVNSAGIIRDAYLLKMTETEFDDVYKINLKGTFLITQHFAKSMVEHKISGTIINISSIVAKLNTVGQCNYAASKAGVASLTQVAAKEFGKFNIRVNAILPGYIETPMTENLPEDVKKIVKERCAMKRFGRPEEVADVVAFLASEKSSYINGALIDVSGCLS
ncbi:estradiol 17-beta-dehydrogenase 8 [Condylostylus longicornis]|uniref:estradiol 17-beta-dehydrogenase 8 n=1 Tax=Condylostylus longicornis TaxID=2530218 RepID=UPI00244E5965|nr:estradiol 17-beta-dehydrogenase 8 [Condylostylus longicornis]